MIFADAFLNAHALLVSHCLSEKISWTSKHYITHNAVHLK